MSYLVSGNNPAAIKTAERNIFTATAGQTTFTITQGYQPGDIDVFLNGVRLIDSDDYTATNGSTVVLTSGAAVGDSLAVVCYRPYQVTDFYTKSEQDTRYVNVAGDTMTGSLGIGVAPSAPLTIGRVSSTSEGGQIDLCRSTDNASTWGIDVYGDTSTPSLRILDNIAAAVRLQIDGSGRVTMPYQPAFHVRGGPTQTGAQVVQYTTVQSNIGSHYNSTLHRFTAPVTGKYYFIANALKDSNHADVTLYLRKNGGTSMSDPSDNTGTGTYISLTTFAVLELVANDYIEVYIGNGNIYSGYRNFCGYLIG